MSSTDQPDPTAPEAWLPAALNQGHTYRDRLRAADLTATSPLGVVTFYTSRYRHSTAEAWNERLAAGQVWCNGQRLRADGPLAVGDQLVWHRPPWQEASVPVLQEHAIVFDDGDLLVLNKPSGLPVLPAGGFLEHTLLAQLQRWPQAHQARPVHRLGRFTSGLLVCARRPESRAWLSAQLRDSTQQTSGAPQARGLKLYRALTTALAPDWAPGEQRPIHLPIGRRPHPLLGQIWCGVAPGEERALDARSDLRLLERRQDACLVEVTIRSGRPHQIRIHTAAIGAPLLGDPLYLAGGLARPEVLPGAGGYRLHAHRLRLCPPMGAALELEAPLPPELERLAHCISAPAGQR